MNDTNKILYLQMVQEVISRMSTISSVVKGFSITLATAIVTIVSADFIEPWIIWMFAPILIMLCLVDMYYLCIERQYRTLYENIRLEKHPVDFLMVIPSEISNEVNYWKCALSKPMSLFYLVIFIIYLVVCFCAK